MTQNAVTEIIKEKKPIITTRGKIRILLLVLFVINFIVYFFLTEAFYKLEEPIDSHNEKGLILQSQIDVLENSLSKIKTPEQCESVIEERKSRTIAVDISFYPEYSEPIKIDSLCTDCTIREVGRVINSKDLPLGFSDLKLITVKTNEENDSNISPKTISHWGYGDPGDVYPFKNFLVNQDYSLIYLPEYFVQEDGTFYEDISSKFNKNLEYNKEYSFSIGENSIPQDMDYDSVLEGKKGLYYEYGFFTGFTLIEFQKEINLVPFDIYDGKTIYVDSANPDNYYIEDREFYIVFLEFYPSIYYDAGEDEIYPILWNDKTINTFEYSYGYEGCSGDYELDTVNIPKEELEISGYTTKSNQPIYEYADKQKDELKTFYEGYKDFNDGWNDEETLSYEDFITSHPLIFWEDETGRMIRFVNSVFSQVGGCAKPIVYLYPEKQTDVTVKVLPTNGALTFTYPTYDGQWKVTASRDGLLKDKFGNQYEYLWWESEHNLPLNIDKGFVVKNDNLDTFFDLTLRKAGFLQNEINDFKEFWIPTMNKEYTPYFKISFLQNKQVDNIAKLLINPQPTTEIRIFMVYERLNSYIDVTIQDIAQTERKGFVVTEWGGTRR